MEKPLYFYKAIAEGINNFGDRHYINARTHLARAMGLKGNNAGIQLSNILNYKSYNPKDPKPMKLRQLAVIFEEIDQEDVMHILNGFGSPYGLITIPKQVWSGVSTTMHSASDDAMRSNNTVFNITQDALSDETLSKQELQAIIKGITRAQVDNATLKHMAETRLKRMEGA